MIPVLGKPSRDFFESARRQMGTAGSNALMIGDDMETDVLGAQAAGISGVLTRTGKFDKRELPQTGPGPDHVIDGIGRLPGLLSALNLV